MILLAFEMVEIYLEDEMNKRGWSQADLARNSGLDPSLINNYLTGKRNVGINSVVSIAKAFGVRPDAVCRAIGLFPPIPEATAQTEQLLHLFSQLDEADKTTIMRMIEVMLMK